MQKEVSEIQAGDVIQVTRSVDTGAINRRTGFPISEMRRGWEVVTGNTVDPKGFHVVETDGGAVRAWPGETYLVRMGD